MLKQSNYLEIFPHRKDFVGQCWCRRTWFWISLEINEMQITYNWTYELSIKIIYFIFINICNSVIFQPTSANGKKWSRRFHVEGKYLAFIFEIKRMTLRYSPTKEHILLADWSKGWRTAIAKCRQNNRRWTVHLKIGMF